MPTVEPGTTLSSGIRSALEAACGDEAVLARVLAVIEPVLENANQRNFDLHRSQATLQSLVDNFPGGIVSVFDPQMRHLLVGGETVARLGFTSEAMLGKTPSEYKPGLGATTLEQTLRRTLMGENVRSLEIDGTMSTLVICTPIYDAAGGLFGAIVVGQDVTDLVHLQEDKLQEERLRAVLEREVATSRARAAIIEQVLHEIRNPLAGLLSSAEMVERYEARMSAEKRAEHLRRINEEVQVLQQTLAQLAQISN
ncbi:MAG: PAS domain-containing protein [Chloroflexi bacterium]|nr:PAS domain-containing protein [Chloroflexota bacterium]